MVSEASFAEISAFMDDLKDEAAVLLSLEGQEGENAFGLKMSEQILRRHPFEVVAMLLSTTCDLVKAEAKIKDLEASVASWESPERLPDNETTRKIGEFLANPESGVRRERPARRVEAAESMKESKDV